MLVIHSWNRYCAYMHTFFSIPLQSRNIATIHFYYLFCRDIENLILKFLVIQHFVYFLFFVWNSYSFFFSELKADAPACAPSPSSAGIPFKGAVWLLLYNLLQVSFPMCRSCCACGIPAEFYLFLQNCGLNAGYSDSLLIWVWVGIKHIWKILTVMIILHFQHISSLFSQQWMTHHALLWIQHVAWKCQVTCHAGETLTW